MLKFSTITACLFALVLASVALLQATAYTASSAQSKGRVFMKEPTSEKTVIILLGPPGSGKGTQAVRLAQELEIPHISSGGLFRENIRNKTALGMQAKAYIDAGKLGPDELVIDMLTDRLAKPDCKNGYLLDGVPRTLFQAEALEKQFDGARLIVPNLRVSDEVVTQRIGGRLTCVKCGHIHHQIFSPPASEGKCDKCGGELVQRSDDKPEVIAERLKVYHEQTAPLIDFYEKKGVLIHINGEQSADAVFAELQMVLESVS